MGTKQKFKGRTSVTPFKSYSSSNIEYCSEISGYEKGNCRRKDASFSPLAPLVVVVGGVCEMPVDVFDQSVQMPSPTTNRSKELNEESDETSFLKLSILTCVTANNDFHLTAVATIRFSK
uniref:Uncharacterized protein n=1 Tax=Pristionchus pacificus TaxID=54126 RepID=A0A2A6BH09_PRIPA|eukprot:PDM65138.1 hypothetical protein PRIPAC_53387 [Pristionchus pacificus]